MKEPLPIAKELLTVYFEECECLTPEEKVAALAALTNTATSVLIELFGKDVAAYALVDTLNKVCGVTIGFEKHGVVH